ncbi:hypothetical protein AYI74_05410 [Shewanella algae]|nr:hypothetical protein AYI85_13245 [Shewanella algae]TVL05370.1 hypothetical protein AYI84_05105 [Shewanella algae]TVL53207.1 hypothetical protein AYI99_06385 [Shewanella algae]TVP05976.1 hypothetical protein AYI73_13360 [Shewanella algae]TWU69212.1 hypothetical protein AYI74_05410 [Shewanella algae]
MEIGIALDAGIRSNTRNSMTLITGVRLASNCRNVMVASSFHMLLVLIVVLRKCYRLSLLLLCVLIMVNLPGTKMIWIILPFVCGLSFWLWEQYLRHKIAKCDQDHLWWGSYITLGNRNLGNDPKPLELWLCFAQNGNKVILLFHL